MKSASFFVIHCLIATGFAKPAVFLGYQDSLGQYSFGYSAPGSARSEVRTSNGATKGTYSYVDETGVIHTAQYVADSENGFRVIATNLPQAPLPVQDTPEVMAARTAHLQALEMARRNEQAQSHGENQNDAPERRIEVNKDDANLDKTREHSEIKSAEISPKEEQQNVSENAENTRKYGLKKDNDESLQAVASKSGVDKESEKNSQGIHEESSGRVSQEIIDGSNIPAIPLISSHVLLPQTPGRHAVPVFRISHGSHEIEPSAISDSSIAQGASGVITPAATALKSAAVLTKEATRDNSTSQKEQQTQPASEQVQPDNILSVPLNIIPLSSSHSSLIRYVSPASLRYVISPYVL